MDEPDTLPWERDLHSSGKQWCHTKYNAWELDGISARDSIELVSILASERQHEVVLNNLGRDSVFFKHFPNEQAAKDFVREKETE